MQNDVTYNQIIIFRKNASLKCKQVKKSFTEKGQLILILDDSNKITISGKNIDASGQRNRINELLLMATEKGFDIPEKSIKHYARDRSDVEYVLVRW